MLFSVPNLVSVRFAKRVGLARKKYYVPVPETTGDPAFVRTFRAQWVLAIVTELRWQSQYLSDNSVTFTELVWYFGNSHNTCLILWWHSHNLSDTWATVTEPAWYFRNSRRTCPTLPCSVRTGYSHRTCLILGCWVSQYTLESHTFSDTSVLSESVLAYSHRTCQILRCLVGIASEPVLWMTNVLSEWWLLSAKDLVRYFDVRPISQRLKKKKGVWWKRRERKQQQQQTNTFWKKEEAGNVSEQRDKGWIHVIRVHDTTRLAVKTTLRGSRRSRTTPHKERLSGLVKHRDYPPHSYIINERCNPRNKRASKERKKTVNVKNRSLGQPQTLTQGGHEIDSLLN